MDRYEKYKDSGVNGSDRRWFGKIPEHWQIKKIKYVASLKSGENIISEQINESDPFPVYGGNGLRGYFNAFTHDGNYVLIGRQGALCGNINYASGKFWASEHAIVCHLDAPQSWIWFGELLKIMDLNQYSQSAAQPGLAVEKIKNLEIPCPPLNEQHFISNYLDKKTSELDTLITKKEKLIELLKEERTAIINQAVTKGLDPDVEMKDSGVEWLGEVPRHWEVKKLKYLVKDLLSGVSVNSEDNPVDGTEEIGILKTSCVYDFSFRSDENKKVLKEEYDRVRCPVTKDSIIISRMNTPDLVGACGYVDMDYNNLYLPDRLWKTTFFEDACINVKYLYTILISDLYKQTISSKATGTSSSMKNISKDDFLTMPIPFPPLVEQIQIRDFMEKKKIEVDVVITKTNQEITLLKEYKTALISEVVTGKVKVV